MSAAGVELSAVDAVLAEWLRCDPTHVPALDVLTEALTYKTSEQLCALIRRLARERKIAGYSHDRNFATLALWMSAGAIR